MNSQNAPSDPESAEMLSHLGREEAARTNRVPGVRTVLVVLSAKAMSFDIEALRQKILLSYPDGMVSYMTPLGKPLGPPVPQRVDLLIDFVGPRERQRLFLAKKLRSMARVAVGRNSGVFRKRIYDRIYDEKTVSGLPSDLIERERFIQRELLRMAGVAVVPYGDTLPDRGKSIARELPPMQKI